MTGYASVQWLSFDSVDAFNPITIIIIPARSRILCGVALAHGSRRLLRIFFFSIIQITVNDFPWRSQHTEMLNAIACNYIYAMKVIKSHATHFDTAGVHINEDQKKSISTFLEKEH